MNFSVEDFAEAVGVTSQTVNQLEAKKTELSATQYVAIAALTDSYFADHEELLPKLRAIIDSDGKSYGEEYETSFRGNSLLQRWFEDFIDFDDATEDFFDDDDDDDDEDFPDEELWDLAQDYKIFIDAETLLTEDAGEFVDNLTAALEAAENQAVLPLRALEELRLDKTEEEILRATTFVRHMQEREVLRIFGEETDPDFHDTILSVFERFRNKYPLCLITANEKLARAVLELNNSATEDDFKIAAAFVDGGFIEFYDTEDFDEDAETDSDEPEDTPPESEFNGWSEL